MAFPPHAQHGHERPQPGRLTGLPGWSRRLLLTVLGVVAVGICVSVAAGVLTDYQWFRSVGHSDVFATTFSLKWVLFGGTAAFMIAVVWLNIWLAYRNRPEVLPLSARHQALESYRALIGARRRPALGLLLGVIGLIAGLNAAGDWRTWLLFANRTSFGIKDPQFRIDVSFFVFVYPFLRAVLSLLFAAVLVSIAAAALVHYLFGGLRPQEKGDRASPPALTQMYLLAGIFVLLKAVAYWLDRYGIDFSRRGIVQTGASYTDVNAILPAKTVLAVIALICAGLFAAGAIRRSSMLPAIGFGLLVLSAILIGGVYPAIIQQFVVKPNELAKERPFLGREIASTRAAYDVAGATTIPYPAVSAETAASLASQAATLPDLRLLDPGVMSPAFVQLQQVKSYYSFPRVLAIDRYPVLGSSLPEDMLVGVRELTGPPAGQGNWVNTHLVYTHGYGVVAAAAGHPASDGSPSFTAAGFSTNADSVLGGYQPRVYFGQQGTGYVIVDTRQAELDYPNQSTGGQQDTSYRGSGGVGIGSALDRLLFAIKFRQLNILLSSAIDSHSKIMYIRDPLARVAKVAPFLTLDGDPYPVVADHQVDWVVDGYTTTDDYPYSQRLGLTQATADSYFPGGSAAGGGQVNYIRNSVKAVVNAYTGQVTLYQWGSADPVLQTWMKAFPGLIRPQSAISAALLEHLRYPEVLFELQRQILAQFHVQQAAAFYGGQNFWSVPADPSLRTSTLPQPPYYLTTTMPGWNSPAFSVVTSFVQRGKANMAALMAVNSDPGSAQYGQIEILQLPQSTAIAGPQQVASHFEQFPATSRDLTLFRAGGSQAVWGNMITMPLGGGLLYAEPLYVFAATSGSSAGSYPVLTMVSVYYNGTVGYAPTLAQALAQVFPSAAPAPPALATAGTLQHYLQEAQAAYAAAQAALRQSPPDWTTFGREMAVMKSALDQATALAGRSALR
jgi:uncharacterized protein